MKASQALAHTNNKGYDYVMSRVEERAGYGYDWLMLEDYLCDRFGKRLESDGYSLARTPCGWKLAWDSPSDRPFNQ